MVAPYCGVRCKQTNKQQDNIRIHGENTSNTYMYGMKTTSWKQGHSSYGKIKLILISHCMYTTKRI